MKSILALLELIADMPAVQAPIAAALAGELGKLGLDAAGRKAIADFLAMLAAQVATLPTPALALVPPGAPVPPPAAPHP